MKDKLNKFLHEFVFRNFFIALCSVSMVFSTFLLNNINLCWTHFTVFLAASTFLLYNFHTYSFQLSYSTIASFKKSFFQFKISTFYLIAFIAAMVISVGQVFYFNKNILLFLIPLTVVTLLYSMPLWGIKKKIRIRESFFVKLPLLGIVWSLSTVVIPLVEQNIDLTSSFVIKQVVCRFLFIFALCVPFEIRDIEIDRSHQVKTLPLVFGIQSTKNIGIFFLMIEIIIHHNMNLPFKIILALDFSSLIALVWIIIQKNNMSVYFYKLFVDGTMVLRFIFIYLALKLL